MPTILGYKAGVSLAFVRKSMGSGASAEGGKAISVDDIKAALTGMKDEDVSKLREAVDSIPDADFYKLRDILAPGTKLQNEADFKYVKTSGLQETLSGLFRSAVKMKPMDLDKFGADYFSGELEKQKRLVLIASNADEPEQFKSCVREKGEMGAPIVSAIYEFGAKPEDFVTQIKDLSKEHGPFKTVALCCHGGEAESIKKDAEGFKWNLLEKCAVQVGKGGDSDPGAEDILKALEEAFTVRIDLLACNLAASKVGMDWITEWEQKMGKNVAASADVTGNVEAGGNWLLETDGIDVSRVYFKQEALAEYVSTFARSAQKNRRHLGQHWSTKIGW